MAPSRHHSNNAVETTLNGAIDGSQTSVSVVSVSGFPTSYPYALTVDFEASTAEIVLVTAAAGTNLTVTRGYDNTVAQAHNATARVMHTAIAADLREPLTHVNDSSGVHGVTGSVVGTTDTQTVTNKTISGSSNTLTNLPAGQITGDYKEGTFVAQAAGNVPLKAKGAASQTADLFQAVDSTGTVKLKVEADGDLDAQSAEIRTLGQVSGGKGRFTAGAASDVPLIVKGAASQSGDLIQAQDSTGAVKARVDADGDMTAGALTVTTATADTLTVDGDGNSSASTAVVVGGATGDALYKAKISKGEMSRGLAVNGRTDVTGDATVSGALTAGSAAVTGILDAGNIEVGAVAITPSAADTPTSATITGLSMPGTNFYGFATARSGVPYTAVREVSVNNASSTGMEVWLTRANTTLTSVNWMIVSA